jgi:hypothetical protein
VKSVAVATSAVATTAVANMERLGLPQRDHISENEKPAWGRARRVRRHPAYSGHHKLRLVSANPQTSIKRADF